MVEPAPHMRMKAARERSSYHAFSRPRCHLPHHRQRYATRGVRFRSLPCRRAERLAET